MAALCAGISYGLSQNCVRNENKELIFLKLTEAASRAIDELQRNHEQLSSATIQFLGNEGCMSFPSKSKNGGVEQFRFSIAETEGQGSFECVQQTHNQLEVLGALPNKMRILANDDVYEQTKHRMAVAEETQKNKCTREIKPNQKDIGRKVKVKSNLGRISNIPSNSSNSTLNKQRDSSSASALSSSSSSQSQQHQQSSNNSNNIYSTHSLSNNNYSTGGHSLSGHQQQHSTSNINHNNNNNNHHHSSASSPPLKNSSSPASASFGAGAYATGSNSTNSHHQQQQQNNTSQHHQPSTANAASSAASSSSSSVSQSSANHLNNSSMPTATNTGRVAHGANPQPQRNPELLKRGIKERLIHMLALRSFKKPELYSRLNNEGVREREKGVLTNMLKSIADFADNTYHLKRRMWNDVNEDWAFYSEQDKQSLKRRKPQNLTPPLSSDGGSSTSGQSPTSTHNGSPPPPVKRPSLSNTEKYSDGPTSKKQRISHCQQGGSSAAQQAAATRRMAGGGGYGEGGSSYGLGASASSGGSSSNQGGSSSNGNSSSSSTSSSRMLGTKQHRRPVVDSRESANLNPRSREAAAGSAAAQQQQRAAASPMTSGYYSGSNATPTSQAPESEDSGLSLSYNVLGSDAAKRISPNSSSSSNSNHMTSPTTASSNASSIRGLIGMTASAPQQQHQQQHQQHMQHQPQQQHQQQQQQHHDMGAVGGMQDGSVGTVMGSHALHPNNVVHGNGEDHDFSAWTAIQSIEQRRRYKSEFDQNYAEYRKLHLYQDEISKRFQDLEKQLMYEKQRGNEPMCTAIRNQIQEEYRCTMDRDIYKNNVKRFTYLHFKLSHIKMLVSDFDLALKRSKAIALPKY